jgi:hypothetical protein
VNDRARDKFRIPRTVGSSIGTGLLAVLMVGVVAFGANTIRPLTAGHDGEPSATEQAQPDKPDAAEPAEPTVEPTDPAAKDDDAAFAGGDETAFREQPDKTPAEEPRSEPTPAPEPTDKPKDEPTTKPEPTEQPKPPVSDHLELDAWTKEGHVKLAWSKYTGDGFDYYKVVRSTDATVTWPLGEGDELVAVVSDQWSPYAVDSPPCGKEFHYRVFAVRHTEDGYKVLAASGVKGASVDCPATPPEPYVMGFEVHLTDAGAVKLAWAACDSETFKYYKVVRSTDATATWPLGDGDQLLAAIGDRSQTTFKDTNVEPGQTWYYRVLSIGTDGAVLGATETVAITIE